jgi:ATP-binding cassette subfamily B (MDR/TAP) protein 1
MMSSMGGVFYYSIWLANRGYVDFEAALAPLFAVMGILVPLLKAGALADLKSASNAAVRLFKIFDRQPLIDNLGEEGATPKRRVEGRIEVSNVTFAYPTAPQKLVCKGYSLSVAAGTTVALCGPSGSGKSTLIQLLERFYDPLSGSITLDGVDVKALNVRWLRSQMGLVSQEPLLFQGTVAQNIAYGKPGVATQAEIEEAAKMANAHDFITEHLANGYETDVGLHGGKLSGGQKQRVAIARAIIKKPAVLLLDEATSALDNESEKIVQAALDEIMTKQKRTTIVIAHRLSTIRTADKIAVVSEGAIVEQGTHEELLSLGGMYTSLALQG